MGFWVGCDANVDVGGVEDHCSCDDGKGEIQSVLTRTQNQMRAMLMLMKGRGCSLALDMGLKKISKGVVVLLVKDLPVACPFMPSNLLRYRY
jgi:hypothetical protein